MALIVFGAVDIAVMVYCVARGVSYSSSFNAFAVLAGVFVWNGHPWWVKWVTRAAGFYVGAFCVFPLVFPFIFPLGLDFVVLRLHPLEAVGGTAAAVGVIGFLIWVYRQLRAPAVLAIYEQPGRRAGPPWLAFALGGALAVGTGAMVGLSLNGDAAKKAIELAKVKTGSGYRYSVSHLSWAGDHGRASVVAYRDDSIETVDVDW
jgi:hypothetical protein